MQNGKRNLTSTHWGVYERADLPSIAADVSADSTNGAHGTDAAGPVLRGLAEDPDPSPIGLSMSQAYRSRLRVQRPAVRKSWLDNGPGAAGARRGSDPFVEIDWPQALDLVAAELDRVRDEHGNSAIFGGSYGWASAGRFHHAQSQIHRFLNAIGGYVRHVDSYSLGAARVLMPHIVATMDWLMDNHHSWEVLAQNTRLVVCFGGMPAKNAQVTPGGASRHGLRGGLAALAAAGCRFVNFSPVATDLDAPPESIEWQPIRPGTDTAVMLALATTIIAAGRHDTAFLERYCVGFDTVRAYLFGEKDRIVKDARWAEAISGVPARRIEQLALELVAQRSLVNVSWSLQRSDHGEQPYWAVVLLGCVIGQVGLPGGGFGVGYGAVNLLGSRHARIGLPTLLQLENPVADFIPVARIADLLLKPGDSFDYNGKRRQYPDIKLVYWAGGNPFHHHQDLNRLMLAWRRPQTIIVHEQVWTATARHADIVLPATTTLERADIGASGRDPIWVAMKPMMSAPGEARDDYAIFSELAQRLGCGERFTEGRDTMQWLRHLYDEAAAKAAAQGVALPGFDEFWERGSIDIPQHGRAPVLLGGFRADPQREPLKTPSGRIELASERIAGFHYHDCPGHPVWQPPAEWLGAALAQRFPLHLLSDQPEGKLHSQLDFSAHSVAGKIDGREPVMMNAQDARERDIADRDLVRLHNERGACLAVAVLSERIMRGVVKLSTGAWYDPASRGVPGALEKHGNPNVLTRDAGASRLSQGCSAQSCLVEVERFAGVPPPVSAFELPGFVRE